MMQLATMAKDLQHFRTLSDPKTILKLAVAIKWLVDEYQDADIRHPDTVKSVIKDAKELAKIYGMD